MSKIFGYNSGPLFDGGSPRSWNLPTHEYGPYADGELTQRHIYGTRYIMWDGRVFKYARANGTLYTQWGAQNFNEWHVKWAALAVQPTIGDSLVDVTIDADDGILRTTGADGAGVIAEDELAGGYIQFYTTDADLVRLNCGILGNELTSGAGTLRLYLDAKLPIQMTVLSYVEILGSPYQNVITVNNGYMSVVGVATRGLTDLQHGWLQTWGPISLSPGATGQSGNGVGSTGEEREVVFGGQGSLYEHNVGDNPDQRQHAGFILNKSQAGDGGPPFIMLQISM